MSSSLHPMLNVAIKAARAAGAIINRAALDVETVRVSVKQTNDFVTEVDHAAEAAIIETLLTAYPDHGIWAEESGRREGKGRDKNHVWIIDPLDGTTNFIHGFPVYCVSIALMVGDRIEQGVREKKGRSDVVLSVEQVKEGLEKLVEEVEKIRGPALRGEKEGEVGVTLDEMVKFSGLSADEFHRIYLSWVEGALCLISLTRGLI